VQVVWFTGVLTFFYGCRPSHYPTEDLSEEDADSDATRRNILARRTELEDKIEFIDVTHSDDEPLVYESAPLKSNPISHGIHSSIYRKETKLVKELRDLTPSGLRRRFREFDFADLLTTENACLLADGTDLLRDVGEYDDRTLGKIAARALKARIEYNQESTSGL
jgi:hypothetical protein